MKGLLPSIMVGATLMIAGCGSTSESPAMVQHWQGIDIQIETRPTPPRAGMTEILTIATDPDGKPVYDLIVSLRTADADPWIQSIQDGHLGVYRRAVRIDIGERSVLQVSLRRRENESVLRFPLKLIP